MLNFDNASTTKISAEALEAFNNACADFYNPSALYGAALEVKKQIEAARQFFVSYFKGAINSTFIFTGSATESNNAVLYSNITRKDKKYLIGAGEHSSVYETAKHFKELGYNVVFVPLNKNGSVDIHALERELDETVAFVSIIHVSNETGAINDIKAITNLVKGYNKNIVVHSDGVQALGKENINLKDLGVDYYTLSAHKINGPKGVGTLYIANVNKFKPLIFGGGQEMGLRSGTENLPAILSFKTAVEKVEIHNFSQHKAAILGAISADCVRVSDEHCVDNIISLCFKGVRGETIEHILEEQGFLIGTGSACNSKAKQNRIISQIVPKDYVEGAVRISFGAEISVEDCQKLGRALNDAVMLYREKTKR